jgi:WD40 repeat protein
LAWNPHKSKSNHLISAGFDHTICHWDIAAASKENRVLNPLQTYKGHTAGVMVRKKIISEGQFPMILIYLFRM